jgi:hypothetical protein
LQAPVPPLWKTVSAELGPAMKRIAATKAPVPHPFIVPLLPGNYRKNSPIIKDRRRQNDDYTIDSFAKHSISLATYVKTQPIKSIVHEIHEIY